MIYFFELVVGYYATGVDSSQGQRARLLNKAGIEYRYIFTEFPDRQLLEFYNQVGIELDYIDSMHLRFAKRKSFVASCLAEELLDKLKEQYVCGNVIKGDRRIILEGNDGMIVEMLLTADEMYCYQVDIKCDAIKVKSDIYTDGLLCSQIYKDGNEIVRRFYNDDRSWAFDEIVDATGNSIVWPNGQSMSQEEAVDRYVKLLNLTKKDTVVIDRGGNSNFFKPVLKYRNNARLIGMFHSIHFGNEKEKAGERSWYYEFVNWIRHIEEFECFVVSTEEQKRDLMMQIADICDYFPRIEVIPAGGLEKLVKSSSPRIPYSLVSVNRLVVNKHVDWLIRATVLAHAKNPDIILRIYGTGSELGKLRQLVAASNAEEYITFGGFVNVLSVLPKYEVCVTASTKESLGISMMEATSAGNALIALNVKYGSSLFVKNGKNGVLIPYESEEDDEITVDKLKEAILDIFSDRDKIKEYEKGSYNIAQSFLVNSVMTKWISLLDE